MTALHRAAGTADLRKIDLLIRRGAQLETENVHEGTVLAHALWHAFHDEPARTQVHAAVIDALIAAGARTDAYPNMRDHITEVRRAGGS